MLWMPTLRPPVARSRAGVEKRGKQITMVKAKACLDVVFLAEYAWKSCVFHVKPCLPCSIAKRLPRLASPCFALPLLPSLSLSLSGFLLFYSPRSSPVLREACLAYCGTLRCEYSPTNHTRHTSSCRPPRPKALFSLSLSALSLFALGVWG